MEEVRQQDEIVAGGEPDVEGAAGLALQTIANPLGAIVLGRDIQHPFPIHGRHTYLRLTQRDLQPEQAVASGDIEQAAHAWIAGGQDLKIVGSGVAGKAEALFFLPHYFVHHRRWDPVAPETAHGQVRTVFYKTVDRGFPARRGSRRCCPYRRANAGRERRRWRASGNNGRQTFPDALQPSENRRGCASPVTRRRWLRPGCQARRHLWRHG